jgi:hypothetical protein
MNAVISARESCLLLAWLASFRRHDLYTGSFKELGNLQYNAKGKAQ